MENGTTIKWLMRGLIVPVRLDPAALNWTVEVARNRYTPKDTQRIYGWLFDYENKRIVLNAWSPALQSPLLNQKDVAEIVDNRIG